MVRSELDAAARRLNDFWEDQVRLQGLVVDVGETLRVKIDERWHMRAPIDVAEAPSATMVPGGLELRSRVTLRTLLFEENGTLICRVERRFDADYWPEL